MFIPMEIFGPGANMPDIGSAARQRGSPSGGGFTGFDQIFDRANVRTGAEKAATRTNATRWNPLDNAARLRQITGRDHRETGENAQAHNDAFTEYQKEVTYILEGDTESTIIPKSMYETENPDFKDLIAEAKSQEKQAEQKQTEPEITAQDVKAAYLKSKGNNPENVNGADEKIIGQEKPSFETYMHKEKLLDNNEALKGEVAARMPSGEMPAAVDKSADPPKYISSEDGNLSLLENASDSKEVKSEKFELREDSKQNEQSGAGETAYGAAHLNTEVKSQSIRGNAQMQQAPDTPVTKENLFDEMVSRIDTMQQDGKQTMTIQLKPEFLGNLSLQVAIDTAGLHVKIDASDAGVRGLVVSSMAQLIQDLENRGMTVVEVEVAHTGINNGDLNRQSGAFSGRGGKSHKSFDGERAEENASIIKTAIALHEYYMETGVSSVQYSA